MGAPQFVTKRRKDVPAMQTLVFFVLLFMVLSWLDREFGNGGEW